MTRRALLGMPLAALVADRLRVARLETFVVKVNQRGNWILVRVSTNAGITGIGDASQGGPDEVVVRFLRQFFDVLKGRSIYDIEWLRRKFEPEIIDQGRPAATAESALEQCLWDIRGKAFGVPVYELFGGRLNPRIRNYANINRSTDPRTPEGFARMAERAIAAGFDAVKLAPFGGMWSMAAVAKVEGFTKLGIECAAAVRKVIGPKRDLLIDAHGLFDLERGLELAQRLEPLNLFWLEEVTPDVDALAKINEAAKMPTAGGESIFGVKGFFHYIGTRAVDIVMPDLKYCGGMLELKKISALAEGAGAPVAPHGPVSPVGNLAAAHVCCTVPNFHILEFSYGEVPWRSEIIEPPEQVENGYLTPSERPGIGAVLNEKALAKYRAD